MTSRASSARSCCPAPPDEVWESLPALLGDDVELAAEPGGRLRGDGPEGERVGVVEEVDAPQRLAFWWVPADGDDAAVVRRDRARP